MSEIKHADKCAETHECVSEHAETHGDLISRKAAIDFIDAGHLCNPNELRWSDNDVVNFLKKRPSAEPEIIRCKNCKYWVRQTYKGTTLSWGNCESEHMWDSIYGETYEVAHIDTNENHFCGYAERRENG